MSLLLLSGKYIAGKIVMWFKRTRWIWYRSRIATTRCCCWGGQEKWCICTNVHRYERCTELFVLASWWLQAFGSLWESLKSNLLLDEIFLLWLSSFFISTFWFFLSKQNYFECCLSLPFYNVFFFTYIFTNDRLFECFFSRSFRERSCGEEWEGKGYFANALPILDYKCLVLLALISI